MLCRLCLRDWLPALAANRKILRFKKGEVIFSEGEEVKGMYFIYSGKVKVHKKWDNGKELIVRLARDSDIVGHRGLGSDTIYPVSATSLVATEICFIDLDFFNSTLKVNHDFLYELMMFFASELKESEKRMRNLAHMSVKGRVANGLLALQAKFGTSPQGCIDIYLSRQDLASYIGTTYETVFRIMNELVEENAISLDGKNIFIESEKTLMRHCKNE